MKSINELKEIDIKNLACYHFDDIIKDRDSYLVDILLVEKLYEYISFFDIPCKTSTGPKPLRIKFDKTNGFIRVRGEEFRHFLLSDDGLFDKMFDKSKYLISEKVVLQLVLIIILEKSKLIHIILYLLNKFDFS